MPKVRGGSAERWNRRTAAATPDYQSGVQNPRVPWKQATLAASEVHSAAVTKAVAEKRFAKGVASSSDESWMKGAAGKGAERFAGGVAAAVGDYEAGVSPFLQTIESTQLPPRGPKGDPRNIQRVAVLAAALHKRKMGGFGMVKLFLGITAISTLIIGGSLLATLFKKDACGADFSQTAIAEAPTATGNGLGMFLFALAAVAPFFFLGAAMDVVSATVIAPGAGPTAMAAVLGDSLVVRNSMGSTPPKILNCWAKGQAAGFVQLTHPSGHDQVRDLRMVHGAAEVLPNFVFGIGEDVQPQELITLSDSGSAVGGDVELFMMLMYYSDLPGVAATLIDSDTLDSRIQELVTIQDTTTATVASTYSGPRALNAASDLLIANTDYALLGAVVGAACGVLTVRGSDSGNLRVGIPGQPSRQDLTCQWFVTLSNRFGIPLIPVFNSANKAGIFIENVQDENLTAVPFSLLLARLK